MRNNLVNLVFSLLILVVGAAAEELLPKASGVGFPILLSAVVFQAMRRPLVELALFAAAAGAFEDAICALPFLSSVSFFLLIAAAFHWIRLPTAVAFAVYPVFQLWLLVWQPAIAGGIYLRLLLAIPFGAVSVAVVFALMMYFGRKIALDEQE